MPLIAKAWKHGRCGDHISHQDELPETDCGSECHVLAALRCPAQLGPAALTDGLDAIVGRHRSAETLEPRRSADCESHKAAQDVPRLKSTGENRSATGRKAVTKQPCSTMSARSAPPSRSLMERSFSLTTCSEPILHDVAAHGSRGLCLVTAEAGDRLASCHAQTLRRRPSLAGRSAITVAG